MAVDFKDLPFGTRPDLSPYIVHLTKCSEGESAFDNLVSILKSGVLRGSDNAGFIKGPNTACCFMDVPLNSLKYVLTKENLAPPNPRYESFGIFMTKAYAYKHGARPVLYLSNRELQELNIPKDELWRVVRFEVQEDGTWVSWLHEREWRCKGEYKIPTNCAVLVENPEYYKKLTQMISEDPDSFKAIPHSIIPLNVICQGFLK